MGWMQTWSRKALLAVSAVFLLIAPALGQTAQSAQTAQAMPSSEPGTIRIWGDPMMRPMLERWEKGFAADHPGVRFENKLFGTVTAIAGLDHKVAELAAMGRELSVDESMSFEWIYRYKPLALKVSSGSLNVQGEAPALAILVNRQNPINQIDLDQLRIGFTCCASQPGSEAEHVKAATWGDLGAKGPFAARPVHPMGLALDGDDADLFRALALNNSYQWSCQYRALPSGRSIVEAVRKDPGALALASVADATPQVKILALVGPSGGQGVLPTRESVADHKYLLSRFTYLIANRAPGQPLDPEVEAFLRYVLSRQGQDDIMRSGGYLPLPAPVAAQQFQKLNREVKAHDSRQ